MKKFKVVMETWRETFSGHDQYDGNVTTIVEAHNAQSAIKKSKKNYYRNKKKLTVHKYSFFVLDFVLHS